MTQTADGRRHAPERKAQLLHRAVPSQPQEAGDHRLGDGLRGAGADLAEELTRGPARGQGQAHRLDQLARGECRPLDAGDDVEKGDLAAARCAGRDHDGLVDGERGKRVARWRGVRDVAADRASILDLDATHGGTRLGEQREVPLHVRAPEDRRVRRQRPDHQIAPALADAGPASKRGEVEERAPRELAGVPGDHEIGAASEGQRVGSLREEADGLARRAGHEKLGRRRVASQRCLRLFRAAFWIARTMCW